MKTGKIISVLLILTLLLTLASCGAGMTKNAKEDGANLIIGDNDTVNEGTEADGQTAPTTTDKNGGGSQEQYLEIKENPAVNASAQSTVTFSLKVDTASYSNVARYINSGSKPPANAVRTEELINYFKYDSLPDHTEGPFSFYTEVGASPFSPQKKMAFIRVKTKDIDKSKLKHNNLTFLIDTSGSMNSYDKLPLLKSAFALLVETFTENDSISIVTYAGSSAIVLDSMSGDRKEEILRAINNLTSEGSTAGAEGIQTAYALAAKNFKKDGNNRVILATDGDFNVGISTTSALGSFISEKRETGVYLSILGFGTGNLRDDVMETLSKNGNGNYAYIDSVHTAKKVLIDELAANLYTVADDVKSQIVFNKDVVSDYRLIGYENRQMSNEDFTNDKKDAGEIGAGTDVIMLFEITLAKEESKLTAEDWLFEVNIRYKNPGETESKPIAYKAKSSCIRTKASADFGWACAVAAFGHILRGSEYTGMANLQSVKALAEASKGEDEKGYRAEFIKLLNAYEKLK